MSDPGGTVRHPLVSTVTFISGDCGGPTLVTDQTVGNGRTTHGWLAAPRTNRIICFRGHLLHFVLPGAGVNEDGGPDARRCTFMVAWWEEDPRCAAIRRAASLMQPQSAPISTG